MTTPDAEDAEDASPSPEYSGDLDGSDMAVDQKNESQTEDGSPSQKNGASKSNSKDPLRPRRKKARRACFACQRAHLTCGEFFFLLFFLYPTLLPYISILHKR
jgi:hypothetical protein